VRYGGRESQAVNAPDADLILVIKRGKTPKHGDVEVGHMNGAQERDAAHSVPLP
jgi:hypothetical protein